MEIRLRGGPYDGAVITTEGRDMTFTVTEIASSDDPDTIDFERFRYAETQETEAGRRIFQYKPREIPISVRN